MKVINLYRAKLRLGRKNCDEFMYAKALAKQKKKKKQLQLITQKEEKK